MATVRLTIPKTPPYQVLSFGAGQQSVALAVLMVQGVIPKADALVFANVGENSEHPDTLRYLREVFIPYANVNGLNFVETQRQIRNKPSDLHDYTLSPDNRAIPVPLYNEQGSPGNRTCTLEWKVKVVDRWIKAQGVTQCEIIIGFSAEEGSRVAKKPLGWHDRHGNYKFGFEKRFSFPLHDLGINRNKAQNIIAEAGLPIPPSSACWHCPFLSRAKWVEMRNNDPELFARAVGFERAVNTKRTATILDRAHKMTEAVTDYPMFGDSVTMQSKPKFNSSNDKFYLYPKTGGQMRPLEDAVPKDQLSLFDQLLNETCEEGYCGL